MVNSGWNPAYGPPGARGPGGGLAVGSAAGLLAAGVAALLWAVTVEVSGYKLGFAAIAVGLLVGQVMALTAGASRWLPPVAAGLALVGCLLGDVLVDARELAGVIGMGTPAMVRYLFTHPDLLVDVVKAGSSPLSIAFWAIAAGAGYRLAARSLDRDHGRPVPRTVAGPAGRPAPYIGTAPVYVGATSAGVGAAPAYLGAPPSAPAPLAGPAGPAPAPVVARHPSDFFSRPSEPRHTPQARQAALADQGLLQTLPSNPNPKAPTPTVTRPARTI